MFNWKKHCFIWLSSLTLSLLLLATRSEGYSVTSPEFTHPEGARYLWSGDPSSDELLWMPVTDLYHSTTSKYFVTGMYSAFGGVSWVLSTGVTENFDKTPRTVLSFPESYGYLGHPLNTDWVLGVGGWLDGEDRNFRFLTTDLADFTNLQAVGRNAFENLGHQQEATTVTEITVPDKCNQIEEYAWKNCTFLKKVTFLCPNITYMSPHAFDRCYDTLEEVRIVAAENTTEEWLKQNIVSLKSAGKQAGLSENPKDWTESDRKEIRNVAPVNTVTDFVATFEGHGFSWTIEEEDNGQRFIVLRKSLIDTEPNASEDDGTSTDNVDETTPTENDDTSNSSDDTSVEDIDDEVVVSTPDSSDDDTSNPPIDIANKENVLIDKQVYSSHDQSILTEDLKITAPDGTELPNTDYDIYLRWVKDGETSEWVKYVDKDSLKVRDAGTYTIQYVVYYKGDNPDLKSNPEGLNVTEDASGIHVTINGE